MAEFGIGDKMQEFLRLANTFRETPIVDDNFPELRDRFDLALERLSERLPTIVCLCGSTRFGEAFQKAMLDKTLAGEIVLTVGCVTQSDPELQASGIITDEVKTKLDDLHKCKIDLADYIFVLNVGGYVGSSTRGEIQHARQTGKDVQWLEAVRYSSTPCDECKSAYVRIIGGISGDFHTPRGYAAVDVTNYECEYCCEQWSD
jgi:hypothetical protein